MTTPGWNKLLERLARGLEQGSKAWTVAQRKESLARLLHAHRKDESQLPPRLDALLVRWEEGKADTPAELAQADAHEALEPSSTVQATQLAAATGSSRGSPETAPADPRLLSALSTLVGELTEGLLLLSGDDEWARAQVALVQARLSEGWDARSVRATAALAHEARRRQTVLKSQQDAAQAALRDLVPRLLQDIGGLDQSTGRFEAELSHHAQAIAAADSLPGLAAQVQALVADTQSVRHVVVQTRTRLTEEGRRASELQAQVESLKVQLRELAEEVSTDALTGVANRRGLQERFAAESARAQRDGLSLTVGLLDIDNFKKLNDSLGHAAGDLALQGLAQKVQHSLRPMDSVARFGGEEFVVLLPSTAVEEAQAVLTRTQRALSAALFMHEGKEVFVTFSAGVSAWREGEPLNTALERADAALYEAKRTGKNRTCIG